MNTDIERWKSDGNLPATIERTEREKTDLLAIVSTLENEHSIRFGRC